MTESRKQMRFATLSDLQALQQQVLEQAERSVSELSLMCAPDKALHILKALKFERLISDPIFGEKLNFIEYLNQLFTYLVCIYAGIDIMKRWPSTVIVINFETQAGFDVASEDGAIVCECFAATSVKSNEKLKKDLQRVSSSGAQQRLVFFHTASFNLDEPYIERMKKQYPDVELCFVPFDGMTQLVEIKNIDEVVEYGVL